MGKKKVVVIKGDGIGKEVMDAALSVLSILDLNIKFIEAYAGYECFKKYGDTLPDESLKKAKNPMLFYLELSLQFLDKKVQ